MLTAAGIGSGLDVESIISQLMAIERQPLVALQQKQQNLDADLSAYGTLKSALSTFQTAMKDLSTPSALKVFTASSGNDDVFTASATNTAAASSFGIEVIRQAERHKFSSGEFLDTDTFGGGAGDTLSVQVGTDVTNTLTIDLSSALTLGEIRDAINTDPVNPGVTATIILGNNGNQKLVLTAGESGAAHALTLSYGGSVTAGDFSFAEINNIAGNTSLLDAEISVDGYHVTRPSNTIDDVIQGVTLDLHGADPGTSYTLDIGRDTEAVADSVRAFVDAFNEMRSTLGGLQKNELQGDGSLLSIERSLFSVINTPATGLPSGLSYLTEIGVSFQKDGTMTVDDADLDSALTNNFNAVSEIFATTGQGYANRMDTLVDNWLQVGGLLDIRTDSLDDRKDSLQDDGLRLEYRLTQIEARYRAQFSALDTLLGNLQGTSEYLSQQLDNLPGFVDQSG